MTILSERLAFRWIKRYKKFFFIGVLIICLQVFLAYKSLVISDLNVISGNQENAVPSIYTSNTKETPDISPHQATETPDEHHVESREDESANSILNNLILQSGCSLKGKETVSALQRAKTKECRQHIADIACAIEAGQFYETKLPRDCPSGNYSAYNLLGCYQDQKNDRLLSSYFVNLQTTNSPIECIRICLQSGFPYAGVQYKSECFCGDDKPPNHAKIPDSSCNMKCSGDAKEVCGGFYTINIYETGIAKFHPRTAVITPNQNAERVKIAFLLTLNGRALRQVHRLIRALYSPDHIYFIHVDARQDYLYRNLLELEQLFPNIFVTNKRFSTIWGGASLLTMLLQCMEDLLASSSLKWDFVINLSESDFPVKTIHKLADFLTANKGFNFVKSHGRETQRFIKKQGLDKTFVECDTHMWRIGDRLLPDGIEIDGGSDWVALSREFVQYIISKKHDDVLLKGLMTIFNHTLLPAESFFHTVLRNSKFCHTYIDNNLHVTNWKRKLGCKCQYKHVVDWCGCSPNDFRSEDWKRLKATSSKMIFFARKFEPVINQKILLQLEEWIYGPYSIDYINLADYWQSFYDSNDKTIDKKDYILLTIGNSLLRLISQRLTLDQMSLLEMTHYFNDDKYKGFLLRFSSTKNNETYEFETRVKPIQYIKIAKSSKFAKRLQDLEVSSDFDQKEQISRNFAKMLGPFSEPTVSFTFIGAPTKNENTHHSYNVTVTWVDPYGIVKNFNELHVEDAQTDAIYFSKAVLKQPITPGVWTLKLIGRTMIYAQTKFMISPLDLNKENTTTTNKKTKRNSDALAFPSEWLKYLKNITNAYKTMDNANNPELDDIGHHRWIDSLVSKFYQFREICHINREPSQTDPAIVPLALLPLCSDTRWSSLAPDPKSDVKILPK